MDDMDIDWGSIGAATEDRPDEHSALFDDIRAAENAALLNAGKTHTVASMTSEDVAGALMNFTKPATKKPMVYSDQQKHIFKLFADKNSGHVVVIARAGSSKTTTSIEGGTYAPERRIMYSAFGKEIAAELNQRIDLKAMHHARAKTTHSLGLGYIRRHRKDIDIKDGVDFDRSKTMTSRYFSKEVNKWDIEAKAFCMENAWQIVKALEYTKIMAPYATTPQEIFNVCVDMNCYSTDYRTTHTKPGCRCQPPVDSYGIRQWRPGQHCEHVKPLIDIVCEIALLIIMQLTINALEGKGKLLLDFGDMLMLPVRCGWVTPDYPLMIIDEAQDLSFTQIEMCTLACSGRVFLIGDNMQAIYAWRGADSDALNRMGKELKAQQASLTTCYRCAKAIIAEAQKYCPDINAWEESPEGEVIYLNDLKMMEHVQKGDFVISRSNAPLMAICLRLIVAGIPAKMAGADIGKQLLRILASCEGTGKNKREFVDRKDMWDRLTEWSKLEKEALKEMVERKFIDAKPERIEEEILIRHNDVDDKLGMFNALLMRLKTPQAVVKRIQSLFEDDENEDKKAKTDRSGYVLCTSVHKAKGLEADNCFVLKDTLLRRKGQEEINIAYVAVTRAKKKLYYVIKDVEDEGLKDASSIQDCRQTDDSNYLEGVAQGALDPVADCGVLHSC